MEHHPYAEYGANGSRYFVCLAEQFRVFSISTIDSKIYDSRRLFVRILVASEAESCKSEAKKNAEK